MQLNQPRQVIYRPTPFNFEDIQEKADEYLNTVRGEAARIAENARKEIISLRDRINQELVDKRAELAKKEKELHARQEKLNVEAEQVKSLRQEIEAAKYEEARESGRKTGYEQGHAEGYDAGKEQALADYDVRLKAEADRITGESLATLMPALKAAVEHLSNAENKFVASWEQGALRVASAIAHQAISRELPNMIDVPLRLLREALELAVGSMRLKIRMNPDDVEALQSQIDTLVREITPAAETEIISDIRVASGGCYLETTQGIIDQRIESRLERIVSELEQY
ncbi:MAG: FliH/SctL family protein [Planctomycetaceae bacterium]|nr:FliH/SctL family protein [Planctomycetaceae bacterium]